VGVAQNIRVLAGYYARIRFARLASLIGLSVVVSVDSLASCFDCYASAPERHRCRCACGWQDAERFLSEMVSNKMVYAKVDRPAGIVVFKKARSPTDVLTDWSGECMVVLWLQLGLRVFISPLCRFLCAADISQLLSLVDSTCHLINKENMLHQIPGV
jgi:26S proteasome regulatory subunit N5